MSNNDCRTVVASNLPPDLITAEDVTLFFESSRYCPAGGDVSHVEIRANQHSAVVTFKDKLGIVTAICEQYLLVMFVIVRQQRH